MEFKQWQIFKKSSRLFQFNVELRHLPTEITKAVYGPSRNQEMRFGLGVVA
jgi:hypothetical protein